MNTVESIFDGNAHPGCGILVGSLGGRAVIACLMTGRSESDRGRIFAEAGEALSILDCDPNGEIRSGRAIYSPLRACARGVAVSSGDQTDTVCESLLAGHTFQYAMSARCYEPDAPVFTPRIAGIVLPTGRYTLGIVRRADDSADCRRKYWSFDPKEGTAQLLCTCEGDGNPPRAFSGDPIETEIDGTPAELSERIWRALDAENRVSLYVRYTNLVSGRYESAFKNARLGD